MDGATPPVPAALLRTLGVEGSAAVVRPIELVAAAAAAGPFAACHTHAMVVVRLADRHEDWDERVRIPRRPCGETHDWQ